MAFTKCSRCGKSFHLRLTNEKALNDLRKKEMNNEVLCLGCFKTLKEYDVVRVIARNTTVPEAKVGDIGAVLMLMNSKEGKVDYEVECVLPDGTNKWLGTFEREQLKWLQSPNEQNT